MRLIRFGANGWRARVGDGFDESSVTRIASALGLTWGRKAPGATVLVGYDTRRDSERLAVVLGEVIASYGLQVQVSDRVCPTPALGWSVAHDPSCIGGVMLSASEAPHDYGGILVRGSDGGPVSEELAERIEQRIAGDPAHDRAEVTRTDLVSAYVASLVGAADSRVMARRSPRIVVDAMHGAGAGILSSVLREVGCEVIGLHDRPIRDFRGLHPDPCEPWVDECEREVVRTKADAGIVVDGDCDRAALVDAGGRLVSTHVMTSLVLEQAIVRRGEPGRVVGTTATSVRVERQARRLGCEFTMVPVGFQSIYREFGEGDVAFATEEYGGVCVPSHLKERDGILCALLLAELLARRGKTVGELVDDATTTLGRMEYGMRERLMDAASIQRLHNLLPGLNPPEVAGMVPLRVSHADGLRLWLPDGAWLLLRPSRSRGSARVYAEAPDVATRDRLLEAAWGLVEP